MVDNVVIPVAFGYGLLDQGFFIFFLVIMRSLLSLMYLKYIERLALQRFHFNCYRMRSYGYICFSSTKCLILWISDMLFFFGIIPPLKDIYNVINEWKIYYREYKQTYFFSWFINYALHGSKCCLKILLFDKEEKCSNVITNVAYN